ncbi:MAG: HK97-gp10 family putative phage morphogenesis protein [Candidatus Bathyarchaeia archaeon]
MSIEFQVTIKGMEEFESKMGALDADMQDHISQALMQTAQEIVLRAKQLAPVKTGRLQSNIYPQAIDKYTVKVGCYVPYALFQEFGTRRIMPRLFLTRALQENAPKLVSFMSSALQQAVEEASV